MKDSGKMIKHPLKFLRLSRFLLLLNHQLFLNVSRNFIDCLNNRVKEEKFHAETELYRWRRKNGSKFLLFSLRHCMNSRKQSLQMRLNLLAAVAVVNIRRCCR